MHSKRKQKSPSPLIVFDSPETHKLQKWGASNKFGKGEKPSVKRGFAQNMENQVPMKALMHRSKLRTYHIEKTGPSLIEKLIILITTATIRW
ncbi:hypothetical protein PT277_00240 [Acetobacteraceae bacterium ESL0709]|nr:hypothetical protein [Acetobacteraceae bacterium ESL0709]